MTVSARRLLLGVTVFWSAILLLLVQPMMTKAILPWFGGSAGTWTASMLFYQTALLLGYFYAHIVARRLPLRTQTFVHWGVLGLSLLLLPLQPSEAWKPENGNQPLSSILGLLATSVGLPYLILSTTSPLLQSWYTRTLGAAVPYRLFAISNLGSLLALLSYPFIVEPLLPVKMQLRVWSIGYVVFALLCALIASFNLPTKETALAVHGRISPRVPIWLGLATVPSILWLAMANHLSQDVAAVPFLWVMPLSVYLLSFVLSFDSSRWYRPSVYKWLLPVAWVAITWPVAQQGFLTFRYTVPLFGLALFICCMFCHGELAKLRPPAEELTSYYLTIAVGGALGGVFVGVIAPAIFNQYLELPIGLLGSVLLAMALLYAASKKRIVRIGLTAGAAVVAALFVRNEKAQHILEFRNFYGTLKVADTSSPTTVRALFNGSIQHGLQYISPEKSRLRTSYYGPASGVALAVQAARNGPMRMGVIGLGVGTLAAFGEPGDFIRFYEINPLVVHLANVEFRYLRESSAKVDVKLGDARLSLENEPKQNYDVFVVDAFSGDSIPVHLLTAEAFDLYFHHLKPEGALVLNITNKHLDLAPVVKRLAESQKRASMVIHNTSELQNNINAATWAVVTANKDIVDHLGWLSSPVRKLGPLWTDDYTNLWGVLK